MQFGIRDLLSVDLGPLGGSFFIYTYIQYINTSLLAWFEHGPFSHDFGETANNEITGISCLSLRNKEKSVDPSSFLQRKKLEAPCSWNQINFKSDAKGGIAKYEAGPPRDTKKIIWSSSIALTRQRKSEALF